MRAFSSSPTSLSSPPASSISNPASPSHLNRGRANIDMDEIVVDTAGGPRFGVMAPPQPPASDVPLTAAGLPRKKPGRKPGSTVKPKLNPDGTPIVEPPKARKPRKPRDPNAMPQPRKRKAATQDNDATPADSPAPSAATPATATPTPAAGTPAAASPATGLQQPKITELASMRMEIDSTPPAVASALSAATDSHQPSPAKIPKREGIMSLLNDDPPPRPPPPAAAAAAAAPPAPGRLAFDPVRSSSSSNYDRVRETMLTRDPYGTAGLSSPRAPSYRLNRASASPSISSLVDPPVAPTVVSPTPGHASFNAPPTAAAAAASTATTNTQYRFQESSSLPASPYQQTIKEAPSRSPAPVKPAIPAEIAKSVPALMPQPPSNEPAKEPTKEPVKEPTREPIKEPTKPTPAPAPKSMAPPAPVLAPSKKVAAVQAQSRKEKKKASSTSSSPKMGSLKMALPDVAPLPSTSSNDRSILDFGKAAPGEGTEAPSIVINITLNGESNKYVNFMRLAEEKYGWEALHPRQAADRERKARIAAASAALEKQQSGRDSAEEEDPEFNAASDDENSNVEMGGMGNNGGLTSGADATAPEKPKRKKRNWREDEYDKEDDFVDDSEMLWEEQAAAVKDGFFVYSGPLIPEAPKPPSNEGTPKRGRGGRRGGGAGSRGGRGGAESGRGRGGGPGSRGGTTRKPRITKLEKQRMETEKAERENMAKAVTSKSGANNNNSNGASTTTNGSNHTTNGASSNTSSYSLLQGLAGTTASVPSLSAGLGAGLLVNQ